MQCLELYTACILSQCYWDKAFHFHFLVKTITDSVRLGVVYLLKFSVQYSEQVYVLWNLSTVCETHHPDPQFIYIFSSFFLTDPRSWITDPQTCFFQETSKFCSLRLFLLFDHWSNHLFQSNQRFQAIEFMDRPVPEKLDMHMKWYK